MGYLRGVSCAQRLALPMGLNGPFLYSRISRHVCARRRERSRAVGAVGAPRRTKGKENADWKRCSAARADCAKPSWGFFPAPREFSYLPV